MVADAGVGLGEGAAAVAEWADPDGGAVVDPGVGVEDGAAAGADQGVVVEDWEVGEREERSVEGAEGDDEVVGIGSGRGPRVPWESEAFD